jgi:hypothetical protein
MAIPDSEVALALFPIAMELPPTADALQPIAVEPTPWAAALLPIAMLLAAVAEVLRPTAVEEPPVALAPLPMAVLLAAPASLDATPPLITLAGLTIQALAGADNKAPVSSTPAVALLLISLRRPPFLPLAVANSHATTQAPSVAFHTNR